MAHVYAATLDAYRSAPVELREVISALDDAQLDATPVAGTWSIRQIVVHLLHAELFLTARMLQIAAEDVPLLMNWDENAFAARLSARAVPMQVAIATINHLRTATFATLGELPEPDFERVGIHSKAGKLTLRDVLHKAASHFEHHMTHLRRKRAMVIA